MTLTVGTQLGSFEITGKLGAGGMGEVYRATDTRLGREVAIKTLPASLAGDADRLARFEREAKLLASLNHAHIAAVHSLDETEGTLYIVMELVEGESLEQRLERGPVPLEDALQYGLQIASALEAAHDKGVVHRDLKPANVMLTPDGMIKVLDFGLAKAFAGSPGEASPMHSPALSAAMTQQGLVLGTAGYMSPEQASGQATDQRADIWAFGVVMYEMLTGQPLFSGESVPHILADVLKTAPDWNRLPADLHPRLRLMLERCLEKKPRDRYAGIADVRVDIERVLRDPEGASVGIGGEASAAATARRARPVAVSVAGLVGAVVVGLLAWLNWPAPSAPGPVFRFSIPLPDGQRFTQDNGQSIALSPDGTRIAYVAQNQIYVRNAGEPEPVPVPGATSDDGVIWDPTFSPDGQWLAFVQLASTSGPFVINRIPVSGGAAVAVGPPDGADVPFGLSWPAADTLLFANQEGVVRMPANGGATEVLVPSADDERFFSPQLLPDGETVLFTRVPLLGASGAIRPVELENAQIAVQSIGSDDRTVVWEGGSAARYVETGHLIYAQAAALFAIPFDPAMRAVAGGPVPILQNLRRGRLSVTDTAQFAISATGTLASIPGDGGTVTAPASPQMTLAWVGRDGVAESLPVRADDYSAARISPDGTKIALVVGRALSPAVPQLWIYDLTTENLSLLTADPAGDDGPVWSPDNRQVYFRSGREPVGVYSIDIETGAVTLVAEGTDDAPNPMPWSISNDGQALALVNGSATYANLAALSLGDNEFRDLIVDPESWESEPSLSPDGRWIVYLQNQGNDAEINVRPYPDAARTRIPVGDGISPVFSRDGSELFYLEPGNGDGGRLMAAPVQYEPTLRVGTPQALFDVAGYIWTGLGRASDVDPSGERFLMIRRSSAPPSGGAEPEAPLPTQRIDVVLNWFEELEARVPVP